MLTGTEPLPPPLQLRLDAVAFVALALAACVWCWSHVQRRRAGTELGRHVWLLAGAILVAGLVLSETVAPVISFAGLGRNWSWLLARAILLGAATLLVSLLVGGASLVAMLRAEIRERAATEAQLEKARTDADAANRAKSDFLAIMSHEIRTPLNAVTGFASLLGETQLDAAQRDYLATINNESRRLTSLINDILDLTKIEQGHLVLERLPFAPIECGNEVLRLLAPRALEKKIDLRFEAQVTGPFLIAGDPLRFRQVLLNLVDNALKFTVEGSVTLLMTWTPSAEGAADGRLTVKVRDTGVGIAQDKLKDLFKMFMQADTSTTRRYGGTGLGLAICHRLVAMMGGEIVARSQPHVGTEFSFSLPVHSVSAPEETNLSQGTEPFPPGYEPRVLIVDDMETNRFLLELFLKRHGFHPDLAASGAEAVKLASENRYDAILMDLQMPDLDGYATTRRIRATEAPGRRTPIIALTASIAKGTRDRCLASGMDEHLSKPLDLPKFRAILTQVVTNAASITQPLSGPDAAPARNDASAPKPR